MCMCIYAGVDNYFCCSTYINKWVHPNSTFLPYGSPCMCVHSSVNFNVDVCISELGTLASLLPGLYWLTEGWGWAWCLVSLLCKKCSFIAELVSPAAAYGTPQSGGQTYTQSAQAYGASGYPSSTTAPPAQGSYSSQPGYGTQAAYTGYSQQPAASTPQRYLALLPHLRHQGGTE